MLSNSVHVSRLFIVALHCSRCACREVCQQYLPHRNQHAVRIELLPAGRHHTGTRLVHVADDSVAALQAQANSHCRLLRTQGAQIMLQSACMYACILIWRTQAPAIISTNLTSHQASRAPAITVPMGFTAGGESTSPAPGYNCRNCRGNLKLSFI